MAPTPQNTGGFSVEGIACPSCGAPLNVPEGATTVTCQFCGCTAHISYGNQSAPPTGIEPDGTIRDKGSGYGIFRLPTAQGWRVLDSSMQRTGSTSRPCVAEARLCDDALGFMSLRIGDAGTRNSKGMDMLMAQYGGHLRGIDHANYAAPPDPMLLADQTAGQLAAGLKATSLVFARQLAAPNLAAEQNETLAHYQRLAQIQGGIIRDPFTAIVARCYDAQLSDKLWKICVYVKMRACKDGSGVGEGPLPGLGGLFGGLFGGGGGLFGGGGDTFGGGTLFGAGGFGGSGPFGGQQTATPQQQAAPGTQYAGGSGWCIPDMGSYMSDGTVYWDVPLVATFTAPGEVFDERLTGAFLPLVSGVEIHNDLNNIALQAVQQEGAQIQSATQTQLAQNQAQFQAMQEANRQVQAAHDAQLASWQAASDAHHQAFRERTNAQFNTTSGGSSPDFSEAIRGVNTYVTSDGREVEVSVQAEHVYENPGGDVYGTSSHFEPGGDWTEIGRK